MYKSTDKICDLMAHEEDAIQIISRFGLEMGVGEQTIAQVCEAHGVHTPTFLAVVNYKVCQLRPQPADIDIPTLQRYLKNAHTYFLDFRLPRLRRSLIEAIIPADPTTKIPGLILRCYDEFVDEIRTHIEHENAGLFDEHEHDVLVQIVKGLSNKEIANVLHISTHTVVSHRKHITRKLNIHSSAGLTIYAIVNHLIDLNSLDS